MKLTVLWSEDAERLLLAMAPTEAERIVNATVRLADEKTGFVRRMLDGSMERRLYIEGWIVTFTVDRSVMYVWRIDPR